jgi:hypothetical protein
MSEVQMPTDSVRSMDRLVVIVPACTAPLDPQKPPASDTPVREYGTDPVYANEDNAFSRP